MEMSLSFEDDDLNFKATELRLGLPGSEEPEKRRSTMTKNNKRASPEVNEEYCRSTSSSCTLNTGINDEKEDVPPTK